MRKCLLLFISLVSSLQVHAGSTTVIAVRGEVQRCKDLVSEAGRSFVRIADLRIVLADGSRTKIGELLHPIAPPLNSNSLILDSSIVKSLDRTLLHGQANLDVLMMDLNSTFLVGGRPYKDEHGLPLAILKKLEPTDPLRVKEQDRSKTMQPSQSHIAIATNFATQAPDWAFSTYVEAFRVSVSSRIDPRIDPIRQAMRAMLASLYFGNRIVVTPETAYEDLKFIPNGYLPRVVTPPLSEDSEFQVIYEALREARVGKKGSNLGEADVMIVAESILATREAGAVPTFVTADAGVYNRLLRAFSPEFRSEQTSFPVPEKFPRGFLIRIPGRSQVHEMNVLPISSKPPADARIEFEPW